MKATKSKGSHLLETLRSISNLTEASRHPCKFSTVSYSEEMAVSSGGEVNNLIPCPTEISYFDF